MARLQVPVAQRFADLDAYGHTNNVDVMRFLEEARIAAFWRHDGVVGAFPTAVLDAGPGADTHTVIARQEVEYLAPLGYHPGGVLVELWLGHLGGASIEVCYEVVVPDDDGGSPTSQRGRQVAVRATTVVVLLDAATGRPRRITPEERAAWEPIVDPPIAHRRRA